MRALFALLVSTVAAATILAPQSSVAAAASAIGRAAEADRMPDATGAKPAHGQLIPGVRDPRADETSNQPPGASPTSPPTDWADYIDAVNGFRIRYPADFEARVQNDSTPAHFTPVPVASIFFMNPVMAKGALAGVEAPDLSLRVYLSGEIDSLRSWLVSVGFAAKGTSVQSYRNASMQGLRVCQPTAIAPGCSVYIFHGSRVYQLTPVSREGEAMIKTFTVETGN